MPLRIGLIGCGRIMEQGHAPVLRGHGWTIWQRRRRGRPHAPSASTSSATALAIPPATRFTATIENLLRSGLVDAVDIAVPHRYHAPVCLAAARTRTPFLSEKPLATSLGQADEIIAEVEKNDIPAGIMHNYLNRPSTAATLAAIEAGRIGRPFMFRMEQHGQRLVRRRGGL